MSLYLSYIRMYSDFRQHSGLLHQRFPSECVSTSVTYECLIFLGIAIHGLLVLDMHHSYKHSHMVRYLNLYGHSRLQSGKSFFTLIGLATYSEHDQHLKSVSPKCDKRSHRLINSGALSKKKKFPGGILNRVFGFDLGKYALNQLQERATDGSNTGSIAPQMLMMLAIQSTVGMIQTIISDVLVVVPPLIPPPIWINQPLPCLPMVTGHNCFGAILYPITLADFTIASVTDKSVDGTFLRNITMRVAFTNTTYAMSSDEL